MKFVKNANVLKNLDNYGSEVSDLVKNYVSKNMDAGKNPERFIKKNLGKVRIKEKGKVTEIENRQIRRAFRPLNPWSRTVNMDVDLDSGRINMSDLNKNVLTRVHKPADKPSKASQTFKKIVGGAALGAGAVIGAQQYNKKDGDYVKQKRRGL